MSYAGGFALSVCGLQLIMGTDAVFSLFCFAFLMLATLAFNFAGGFTRPSGSYIFFFATLSLVAGLVAKIVFWEPAQTHLRLPMLTIEAYTCGMAGMAVAAYLSRRFARRPGLLQEMVTAANLRAAAIGCVLAGIAIPFVGNIVNRGGESVLTPLFTASYQLNRFLPMAVILGVTYEIKASGGRRSINLPVLLSFGWQFFDGAILHFSKEALFGPAVCWLATGAALGYRFGRLQLVGGVLVLIFFGYFMVPYCQYGRAFRSETNTFGQNVVVAEDLLTHLDDVRAHYLQDQANLDRAETKDYFDEPHGIFDRLQMVSMDDALIEVTVERGTLGLPVLYGYLANAVPHVFWKNKPNVNMANLYGREVHVLGEQDEVTSVSFSPIGEAFRIAGWYGIFLLAPVVWFCLFFLVDSLCGDLRRSPWGILALAMFAHIAPEGGIGGPIYLMTFGVITITFVAYFSAYVMPLIASLVTPPARKLLPFRTQARLR